MRWVHFPTKSTRRQADVCLRPSSTKGTPSILITTTTSQFLNHHIFTRQFCLQHWPHFLHTAEKLRVISTKGYSEVFQTLGDLGHYLQHVLVCEASSLHAAHKMDRSAFNDHCISSMFVPQSRERLPVGGTMLFLERVFDSSEEITHCIIWCKSGLQCVTTARTPTTVTLLHLEWCGCNSVLPNWFDWFLQDSKLSVGVTQ